MSIYAIADLHLSLAPNTEKPMDVFGSRWLNHTERIRENWCKTITDKDTVIVAGDISWGLKLAEASFDLDWIDKLPGHKVMIKGNHDLWWSGITRMNNMYDSITFLQHDAYFVSSDKDADSDSSDEPNDHDGIWICGSRGWITPDDADFNEDDDRIYKREMLRLRGSLESAQAGADILAFLHFPPVSDPRRFSGFMQLFEDFGVKHVYYGHVHGDDNFRHAIQGIYHGIEYKLISADYLNCCPMKIYE